MLGLGLCRLDSNTSDWKVDSIGVCANCIHIVCTLASQLAAKKGAWHILHNYTTLRYFTPKLWKCHQSNDYYFCVWLHSHSFVFALSLHAHMHAHGILSQCFFFPFGCVYLQRKAIRYVWMHWAEKLASINMHHKHFWHSREEKKSKAERSLELVLL